MKNKIINILKIIIPIVLIFGIMIITVKAFSNDNENNDLKSKTGQELKYIENKLISIAHKLNNISFGHYIISESKIEDSSNNTEKNKNENKEESSNVDESSQKSSNLQNESKIKYELKQESILTTDKKQIDWDYIKTNSELLYSNWAKTLLDFHSLNIENEYILAFSSILDNLIIASKNENKIEVLKQLSQLYSYLPKFEQKYSDDVKHINIEYTKYYTLNSYCLLEESKWTQMKESMNFAKNYFSDVLNSINSNENEQSKISKIYVLINELDNSINLQDKEIFYIKYKELMSELSNM